MRFHPVGPGHRYNRATFSSSPAMRSTACSAIAGTSTRVLTDLTRRLPRRRRLPQCRSNLRHGRSCQRPRHHGPQHQAPEGRFHRDHLQDRIRADLHVDVPRLSRDGPIGLRKTPREEVKLCEGGVFHHRLALPVEDEDALRSRVADQGIAEAREAIQKGPASFTPGRRSGDRSRRGSGCRSGRRRRRGFPGNEDFRRGGCGRCRIDHGGYRRCGGRNRCRCWPGRGFAGETDEFRAEARVRSGVRGDAPRFREQALRHATDGGGVNPWFKRIHRGGTGENDRHVRVSPRSPRAANRKRRGHQRRLRARRPADRGRSP